MKLKNKLIPLTTFATAVAAVTPLTVLSSCAPAAKDITNLQAPSFEQLTQGYTKASDITKEYAKFASEQPENFKADFTWGVYQNWMSFFGSSSNFKYDSGHGNIQYRDAKINKIKFGMSTPKFSSHKISAPGMVGLEYPTISFKINLSVDAKLEVAEGYVDPDSGSTYPDEIKTHNVKFSVEAECKNMPYFAYYAQRQEKNPENWGKEENYSQPHWWITFASESEQQYAYRYAHGLDWGIKTKGNYVDDVITKSRIHGETKHETLSGKLNSNIDNYQDFERFVMLKNYEYMWQQWFNPTAETFPMLLLANAVLMDNESYYLNKLLGEPEIEADLGLGTTLAYSDGRTEDNEVKLNGWLFQPEGKQLPDQLYLKITDDKGQPAYPLALDEEWISYLVYDEDNDYWHTPEQSESSTNDQRVYLQLDVDNTGKMAINMKTDVTYKGGRVNLEIPAKLVKKDGNAVTFIDYNHGAVPQDGDYRIESSSLYFHLPENYKYELLIDSSTTPYSIYPSDFSIFIEDVGK